MKRLRLSSVGLVAAIAGCANQELLTGPFTPNAAVCVRFDAEGHVTDVAVDGQHNAKANGPMLKLLQGRSWDAPSQSLVGKWIAMSVAPDGSPVPELLPDCSKLPSS